MGDPKVLRLTRFSPIAGQVSPLRVVDLPVLACALLAIAPYERTVCFGSAHFPSLLSSCGRTPEAIPRALRRQGLEQRCGVEAILGGLTTLMTLAPPHRARTSTWGCLPPVVQAR